MVEKDENQAGGKYKQTPVGGDSVFATVSLDGRTYQVSFVFVSFRHFFSFYCLFLFYVIFVLLLSVLSLYFLCQG